MQHQGRLIFSTWRFILFVLGLLRGCPLGNGVYAYELPAKGAYILPYPLQCRSGELRPLQVLLGRAAVRTPLKTVHALDPVALNGGQVAHDETAAHEGEGREKQQPGRKDHRQLGTMMDLFCFPKPKIGAMGGLGPALLPRGMTCMIQLQQILRNLQDEQGFEEVRTGSLAQAHLWHRSGHMQHFADNMFEIANPRESEMNPGKVQNVEISHKEESSPPSAYDRGSSYLLKPMSCPLHLSYFFDRSVRLGSPLPLRICEFGHVYRREIPSALCGLMRMREFTQDDGHIMCRTSQVLAEVTAFLLACQKLYKAAGFSRVETVYHLSTRPENSQGSEQEWAHAEGLLRRALEHLEIPFTVARGEGAFYGPKIDIHLPDAGGRLWQTGTLQVDLFSPQNFGFEPAPDSNDRLCLLHRAMCGSLERFFGLVLEHLDGHLPCWLAPTQVAVLSVGEGQGTAAETLLSRLRRAKVRASLDRRPVHISKKLKLHIKYRTPEIWLLGSTDQQRGTVTVRRHHGKQSVVPMERALAAVRRRAKLPF